MYIHKIVMYINISYFIYIYIFVFIVVLPIMKINEI